MSPLSSVLGTATDPLAYLTVALELLPRDPRRATSEDLHRLAAIHAGLQRYVDDLVQQQHELETAGAAQNAEHLFALDGLYGLCLQADHRLTTYTAAVLKAHGFTIDRLIAGDHHIGEN